MERKDRDPVSSLRQLDLSVSQTLLPTPICKLEGLLSRHSKHHFRLCYLCLIKQLLQYLVTDGLLLVDQSGKRQLWEAIWAVYKRSVNDMSAVQVFWDLM